MSKTDIFYKNLKNNAQKLNKFKLSRLLALTSLVQTFSIFALNDSEILHYGSFGAVRGNFRTDWSACSSRRLGLRASRGC